MSGGLQSYADCRYQLYVGSWLNLGKYGATVPLFYAIFEAVNCSYYKVGNFRIFPFKHGQNLLKDFSVKVDLGVSVYDVNALVTL